MLPGVSLFLSLLGKATMIYSHCCKKSGGQKFCPREDMLLFKLLSVQVFKCSTNYRNSVLSRELSTNATANHKYYMVCPHRFVNKLLLQTSPDIEFKVLNISIYKDRAPLQDWCSLNLLLSPLTLNPA